jgi:hypothetical protein
MQTVSPFFSRAPFQTSAASQPANMLPPELASLLTDEAYLILCEESLKEELATLEKAKEEILSTRPPFGMLASRDTRNMFKMSLRKATDSEAGLQERMFRLTQVEGWLKPEITRVMQEYLPTVSGTYRCTQEAAALVGEWEHAASSLHDLVHALARDTHAVAAALNPVSIPNVATPSAAAMEQARSRTLANLRVSLSMLQDGLAELQQINERFAHVCGERADGLRLPRSPVFPPVPWVDQLAMMTRSQATTEALRIESEARAFHAQGLATLLKRAEDVREACHATATLVIEEHGRLLRIHARTHFVKERDVDEVMAELAQHRIASELRRRQETFEAAKMAKLS